MRNTHSHARTHAVISTTPPSLPDLKVEGVRYLNRPGRGADLKPDVGLRAL